MTVYIWDKTTKVYRGTKACQPSPLEPGKFLMPVAYTEKEPPVAASDEIILWDEAKEDWILEKVPVPEPEPEPDPVQVKKDKVLYAVLRSLPEILYKLKDEASSTVWLSSFISDVKIKIDEEEAKNG